MRGGTGVRPAGEDELGTVARLLDDFNTEFGTPSPGPEALEARLRRLLPEGVLVALLHGAPAVGVALVTLRPSVWYPGPVGMLEELYVQPGARGRGAGGALLRAAEEVVLSRGGGALEIGVDSGDAGARRFYERHGYANQDDGRQDRLLLYLRELSSD
jgi:GNAT superfamily N-acetyltransferase